MKNLITFLFFFTIPLFAGIGIGYSDIGTLPVELTSFTAKQNLGSVVLNWNTATEVDNFGFDIERSQKDKAIWEKIGSIGGNGNSNSPKNYYFVDTKPLNGKSEYRLKQVDKNGAFKYSNAIEVVSIILKYDLGQNFPNPFNPTTVITFSIPTASIVTLKVYNITGKLVTTLVNGHKEAGSFQVNFDSKGLGNGIYFYKIQAGNYSTTKKMLLLK